MYKYESWCVYANLDILVRILMYIYGSCVNICKSWCIHINLDVYTMFPDNPWIWLAKEACDCPSDSGPAFTCPETSANRFSDASTDATKESFFLSNETFLLLNVRCEVKRNISDGINGLAILLKGKYSFHFVHNIAGFRVVFLLVLTLRLTGCSFRVLFSNLIQFSFTYENIWLAETVRQTKTLQRCHAYAFSFRPKNCAQGHDIVGHWWLSQLPIS